MYSLNVTQCVGFPIRKSPDRSLFAAPRGLSQLVTSFIGSWCQGIRPVLFFAWTSYLYSLFSELLEFLRKQDNFRIEKVYPFRVAFFHLSVKLYRIFSMRLPLIWKDSINFSILSSFICSFLTHFIQISLNFFFYSIVKFHLPHLAQLRVLCLMLAAELRSAGRSGWTRTIDLTLIRRAL